MIFEEEKSEMLVARVNLGPPGNFGLAQKCPSREMSEMSQSSPTSGNVYLTSKKVARLCVCVCVYTRLSDVP